MVKRRVYDEAFKGMARPGVPVDYRMQKDQFKRLPHRWSDRELGIDPGRIRKWRQRHQKSDQTQTANATHSGEQQQIRRLQRISMARATPLS